VFAEAHRRNAVRPHVFIFVGRQHEMLVAEAGEARVQPFQQFTDIVIGEARAGAADEDEA